MSQPPLLERLKQRKLVQWALAYLAGAWLILQVLGELNDAYHWPPAVMRSVPVLLGIGLFAALVLAWYHGEQGRQRVSGPELLMLTGILVVAGAAVMLVGGGEQTATSTSPAPAGSTPALTPADRSIAVLPFVNMSGDEENEYFSDGMTEDILTNLSRVSGLKVISRTSVMQYKDTKKPLRQIGQELGVAHILEGSVRRAGDRVRISAQLINARTDEHLWAENYDRELKDIFQVQSEIAEHIAAALRTELSPAERTRLAAAPTGDPEAYQLYLKGRFYWNTQRESDRPRALAHYQQALRRDSSFALVYAGLADLYADMTGDEDLHQNWALSKAAARRALELDSTLASPHSALGYIHHWYDWDFPAAEREFRRALELDPAYAVARYDYGRFLVTMGQVDQGIAQVRRAVELDPLTSWMHVGLGEALLFARRYDEAIQAGKAAVELDPEAPYGHSILWQAYLEKGMAAQALAAHRAMAAGDPNHPGALATRAYIHARTGKAAEARKLLAQVEASDRAQREPPNISMARAYTALGDADAAFRWLERARRERDGDIVRLKIDPTLDPLRSDPRFRELLQQVGFR